MNQLDLQVVRIVGESVNGYSRVLVTGPVFAAVKQSNWARKNHEKPSLNFVAMQEGDVWMNLFTINGVKLYVYSNGTKLNFFMNTKQAEACLIAMKLPFDIKKFDLNVVATV